ncbi:MAG: hypothetical protein NT086_08855 [Proteobacteria bacterium]|jgi:hypothetical protein|nr:hypothetical protein [Pseudomonadota bacterium]
MNTLTLDQLRPFAANDVLYRCYGHVIAAGDGTLLVVPITLVSGDLRQLVDGCPVSYHEALTVIETPISMDLPVCVDDGMHCRTVRNLIHLDANPWRIQPARLAVGSDAIWILNSSSGARCGITPDMAFQTE